MLCTVTLTDQPHRRHPCYIPGGACLAWPGLREPLSGLKPLFRKKLIQSYAHLYNAHGVSSKIFLATTM